MFGDSERRNQALNHVRESLKQDPANLELANRYWGGLAGPGGDLRAGITLSRPIEKLLSGR